MQWYRVRSRSSNYCVQFRDNFIVNVMECHDDDANMFSFLWLNVFRITFQANRGGGQNSADRLCIDIICNLCTYSCISPGKWQVTYCFPKLSLYSSFGVLPRSVYIQSGNVYTWPYSCICTNTFDTYCSLCSVEVWSLLLQSLISQIHSQIQSFIESPFGELPVPLIINTSSSPNGHNPVYTTVHDGDNVNVRPGL